MRLKWKKKTLEWTQSGEHWYCTLVTRSRSYKIPVGKGYTQDDAFLDFKRQYQEA